MTPIIDPSALIEAQASAIHDALKMERQVAATFDAFDEKAHIIMGIQLRNGDNMRTAHLIADELREFFRQLNPPPLGMKPSDAAALPVVASAPHTPRHAGRD